MTKNEMINDVIFSLNAVLNSDQLEFVKSVFVVKMQGYDIHEVCSLPSTEVIDNEYIIKRFITDSIAEGTKNSTIKAYIHIVKKFFDITNLSFLDVTSQAIIDYIAYRRVTPNKWGRMNKPSSICNIEKALMVFFKWAYRKHYIDLDVSRDIKRNKVPTKKKDRLSIEEIEACRYAINSINSYDGKTSLKKMRIKKEIRKRKEALFELMLSTGLRVGEIANLRIENISFQNRKIDILEGKTDSSARSVYMSVKASESILRLIGKRRTGYVFTGIRNTDSENKMTNSTINQWAKEIGRSGNCHCDTTVHIYRKTFASEMYRATKNVKLVSILLGHSSTAVTEKYYLVDDLLDIERQVLQVA